MDLKEFCEKNWYYLKDRIPENWDRRKDWIPSVTTILSLIWDDSFEYVKRFHWTKLKEAATEWTRVHDEADNFFKNNSWTVEVNKNILKFHSLYVTKIINSEERYERNWVSWRIDLEAEIDYHKYSWDYNADYKNCKMKSEKYKVQLWGYQFLNWRPWLIVYVKNKLEVVEVPPYYQSIFEELVDYFFKLKQWPQ